MIKLPLYDKHFTANQKKICKRISHRLLRHCEQSDIQSQLDDIEAEDRELREEGAREAAKLMADFNHLYAEDGMGYSEVLLDYYASDMDESLQNSEPDEPFVEDGYLFHLG